MINLLWIHVLQKVHYKILSQAVLVYIQDSDRV